MTTFRMPRAREFAVVRTDGEQPMVRLRAPKFWFEGYTHFGLGRSIPKGLLLVFLTQAEVDSFTATSRAKLRQITYLAAPDQLTCRFNITDAVKAELWPHGTRKVHAEWLDERRVRIYVSKQPEGQQWPSRVDHIYFDREDA